eukprot:3468667-Prymnesium_polylepis.1
MQTPDDRRALTDGAIFEAVEPREDRIDQVNTVPLDDELERSTDAAFHGGSAGRAAGFIAESAFDEMVDDRAQNRGGKVIVLAASLA